MQQVYQEASSQGAEGVLIERLKVQFENKIIRQLAMKVNKCSFGFKENEIFLRICCFVQQHSVLMVSTNNVLYQNSG